MTAKDVYNSEDDIMKEQKKTEKASLILFVACWMVYAVLCMTKNAFGSAIASIVQDGFMTKSQAGVINGAYYVFYGGAQLLLAKLADRVSPVKMLHIALFGALLAMAGLMVAKSYAVMLVLWGLSGLLQFASWPATIRIISQYLIPALRGKAMTLVAFAYCVGSLVNSLIASVVLKFSGWRTIFGLSVVMVLLAWTAFTVLSKKTMPVLARAVESAPTPVRVEKKERNTDTWRVMLASGVLIMLIPAFVRAMLDTGLKSWVPTLIVENYDVSTSFASFLNTGLMLINLSGVFLVNLIYPRVLKNEVTCLALCFVLSLPCLGMLTLIGKISVFTAVLLLTVVTTFMYAGNQLINILMPAKFAAMNLTGGMAAILNAFACFGIVVANFGFGYLADRVGWGITILVWIGMAAISGTLCFFVVRRWKNFLGKTRTL